MSTFELGMGIICLGCVCIVAIILICQFLNRED